MFTERKQVEMAENFYTKNRIRALNDFFRREFFGLPKHEAQQLGTVVVTRGICELPGIARAQAMERVTTFDQFDYNNDPHGEHDFGGFEICTGHKVFWKIDYYNLAMTAGSENPADPRQTTRVLTIMLASEY